MDIHATIPDGALTVDERATLEAVAGSMIPAHAALELPAANDPAILPGIVELAALDFVRTRIALDHLDALAGGRFVAVDAAARVAAAAALRSTAPESYLFLVAITVRCYYRDDRVMRSLGMEPRPPFPKGFPLEQGDWTLLEPVRVRPRLYRDPP